eukprot:GHVU01092845.1.p2 GENE.GHVU01092845.1~~GHVU01092845.1.p2  ORF type:complete len:109 (+),score=8.15 GHVU01092845.1:461-787(+)
MRKAAEHTQEFYIVERYVDFRKSNNVFEVRAFWQGYEEDDEDGYTWEPMEQMLRDTPILLLRALRDWWPRIPQPLRDFIFANAPKRHLPTYERTLIGSYRRGTRGARK